jgi:hypothetical protein
LEAVPQPRNLSHQVFITASVERAVLTYDGQDKCMAFGRSEIASSAPGKGCGGGAGIKYLSCMEKRVGPTHAHKNAYMNSIWAYVWQMDRHRSKSNEGLLGVCTKSARQRFWTQDLCFVERYVYHSAKEANYLLNAGSVSKEFNDWTNKTKD